MQQLLKRLEKIEALNKPPDDTPLAIIYLKNVEDIETGEQKNVFSIYRMSDKFDKVMSESNATEAEVLEVAERYPNIKFIKGE